MMPSTSTSSSSLMSWASLRSLPKHNDGFGAPLRTWTYTHVEHRETTIVSLFASTHVGVVWALELLRECPTTATTTTTSRTSSSSRKSSISESTSLVVARTYFHVPHGDVGASTRAGTSGVVFVSARSVLIHTHHAEPLSLDWFVMDEDVPTSWQRHASAIHLPLMEEDSSATTTTTPKMKQRLLMVAASPWRRRTQSSSSSSSHATTEVRLNILVSTTQADAAPPLHHLTAAVVVVALPCTSRGAQIRTHVCVDVKHVLRLPCAAFVGAYGHTPEACAWHLLTPPPSSSSSSTHMQMMMEGRVVGLLPRRESTKLIEHPSPPTVLSVGFRCEAPSSSSSLPVLVVAHTPHTRESSAVNDDDDDDDDESVLLCIVRRPTQKLHSSVIHRCAPTMIELITPWWRGTDDDDDDDCGGDGGSWRTLESGVYAASIMTEHQRGATCAVSPPLWVGVQPLHLPRNLIHNEGSHHIHLNKLMRTNNSIAGRDAELALSATSSTPTPLCLLEDGDSTLSCDVMMSRSDGTRQLLHLHKLPTTMMMEGTTTTSSSSMNIISALVSESPNVESIYPIDVGRWVARLAMDATTSSSSPWMCACAVVEELMRVCIDVLLPRDISLVMISCTESVMRNTSNNNNNSHSPLPMLHTTMDDVVQRWISMMKVKHLPVLFAWSRNVLMMLCALLVEMDLLSSANKQHEELLRSIVWLMLGAHGMKWAYVGQQDASSRTWQTTHFILMLCQHMAVMPSSSSSSSSASWPSDDDVHPPTTRAALLWLHRMLLLFTCRQQKLSPELLLMDVMCAATHITHDDDDDDDEVDASVADVEDVLLRCVDEERYVSVMDEVLMTCEWWRGLPPSQLAALCRPPTLAVARSSCQHAYRSIMYYAALTATLARCDVVAAHDDDDDDVDESVLVLKPNEGVRGLASPRVVMEVLAELQHEGGIEGEFFIIAPPIHVLQKHTRTSSSSWELWSMMQTLMIASPHLFDAMLRGVADGASKPHTPAPQRNHFQHVLANTHAQHIIRGILAVRCLTTDKLPLLMEVCTRMSKSCRDPASYMAYMAEMKMMLEMEPMRYFFVSLHHHHHHHHPLGNDGMDMIELLPQVLCALRERRSDGALMDVWPQPLNRDLHAYVKDVVADEDVVGGALRRPTIFAVRLVEWCCAAQPHATFSVVLQHLLADVRHIVKLYGHDGDLVFAMLRPLMCSVLAHGWRSLSTQQEHHYVGVDDDVARNDGEVLLATLMKLLQHITSHASTNAIRASYECLRRLLKCTHKQRHDGGGFFRCGEDDEAQTYVLDAKGEPVDTNWWLVPSPVAYTVAMHAGREEMMMFIAECLRLPLRQHLCGVLERCGVVRLDYNPTSTKNNNTDDDGATIMMIRTRFIMEGSCVAYKIHPPRRKKIIMTTVVERNDDDDDDDDDLVHHHDRLSAALSSAVSGISCITHALQAHAGSNNIAQHVPHLLVLEAAVEYLLTAHADGVDAHDADASMHMVCRRLHALIDTVSGEKKVVLLHLLHGRVRGALAQHTQKQTPHTSETVARVVKSYDVSDVHRNIVSVVGANLQRRLVSSLTERRWSGAAALTALYHHVDVVVVASPHDEHQHQGGTHKLLQSRCKAILSAVGLPTTTRPSSSSSCADVAALSAITAPILATVMEKEALMKLRQQQQHLLHEHHVWLHSSSVTSAVAELLFARRCERQRRAWTHLAYDQKDLLQICVERYLHLCHVGALKALDHHRRDEHRQRVERCRLVSSEEAEVREELEAMYVVEMSSLWRYTRAMLGVCLEESRRRGDLRELEEAVWVGFMDGFVAEERRMLMGDEDEEVWGSTQTHTRNMPASRGAHPVHDEEHPHQHHHLNPTPRLTGGVGLVADAGKNLFGAMRQLQREWVETVAPRPTTHNSTSAHVEEGARGGNSTFTTTSHVGALHAALPNTHTDATLASSSATSAPSPATAVRRKKKGGLGAVAVEMPVPHVDEPDVAATPPHANVAPSATVCEPPDVCDDAEHAPPTSTAPHAPTTSAETGARRKKKGGLGAVSVVANEPTTTATPTEAAGVVPEPTPHVAEVMPVVAVLTTQPNAARVVASESEEHAVAWVPPSAGGDELHVVESVGESHPTPCTTAPHTPTTSTAAVRRKKKGGLGAVAVVVSEPTTTSPLATEAVRVAEMPTPPAHELTSVPDALTHTVEADATTTLVVGDLPVADAAPPTPLEMVPAHAGVAPSRAAVDEVASADVVRATQTPTAPHTPTTSAARTGARRKKKGGLGAVSVVDDEPTTTTTTTTTTEVIQAGDGSALCVKAPEAALALVPNTVGATPVLHVFATTHHHAGVAPSTFADEATPLLPEIDVLMHTVEVDAATSPVVGNGEDELARDAAPAAPREMAPAHADIAPSTPVHELHMATSVDATHTLRTSTASHKKKGLGAVVADLPEPHVNEPLADVVAHTVEADVATPPVVVGLSTVASMNESHPTPCTTDPHTPTTSTAAVRRKKKGGLGAVALTGITAATTHTVDEAPHPSIPPPHVDEVPEPRVLLPATSAPEEMMIHRHAHPFLHQQEDEDDHRITAAANYNREAHHQHQRLTGGVGVLADAGSSMMGALSRWKTSIKETVAPRPHPRSSAVEQQQHAHTQHASVDEVVGGHRDRRASGFSGEKRFE